MASKVFVLFSFMLVFLTIQCHAKLLSFSDEQNTSPFEFIKALQGSEKGAKVKGLNEIKKYLHHFGYLSDSYEVQRPGSGENYFDDVLESAIKTYQVNYNLNVTGTLDVETISEMMLPRCGVPDIVNGETSMRSGKDKTMQNNQGQSKKAHMVSHYTFFSGRQRWPSSRPRLSYGFINNGGNAGYVNLIGQAFNRWTTGTSSRFTFNRVQNSANANIKIAVAARDHGDGSKFDGPYGVLAHAFAPTDGRLHFDGEEKWALGSPASNQIHMESVAVHEIGHNLGLGHSSDKAAIMFPSISAGQIKVILGPDDIAGINELYRN